MKGERFQFVGSQSARDRPGTVARDLAEFDGEVHGTEESRRRQTASAFFWALQAIGMENPSSRSLISTHAFKLERPMKDHRVAPRTLRENSINGADFLPCTYWLDQAEVPEAALWEAVRARGSSDRADPQIETLLSEACKASGMDSTFLVRDNAISHCVNGGPLKLVEGESLGWFAAISEELVAAGSWQTHALDRERADAPIGLPLRVKTLFVLPVKRSGTAAAVMLCGISQMRVVLDGRQMDALNQLSLRLYPMVRGGTETIGASGSRSLPTTSGSGKSRKTRRRAVFGHVFGGRDAVTKSIAVY